LVTKRPAEGVTKFATAQMSLTEIVRATSQQILTTEDDQSIELALDPPLSDSEIDELQGRIPCPIPEDVRELLLYSSGFSGCAVDFVDFTGRNCSFEYEPAFPHGLPIAADGFGNFWVVDLLPSSTIWGPIYFACHDPPVILFQSATLEEFLTELFKLDVPPHKSRLDDVHEDCLFNVWRKNPGVLQHADAAASSDPDLRSFAQSLGPTFQFIDLRQPDIGFGFSWGRYGPQTVVKRYGYVPIFAYEKKKSIISRLFAQ